MMDQDKYAKQYLAKHAKDVKELEHFINKLPPIEGFIGEWVGTTFWYGGNQPSKNYVLTNDKIDVMFKFLPGGVGSTSFRIADGSWRTFDRRGVESSFYWKPCDGAPKGERVEAVLEEQLQRIADRRKFFTTAIKIPQLGFSISPDSLAKLKETFRKKGSHSFAPSGFGTGYTVSAKPLGSGWRASKELETFFGVQPLFIETFDAD